MYDPATSRSLSEAFPLQEVLHSPIKDSAANYFFHHKLLDDCSLLSLPLFGSLLFSHPAMNEKQMNGSLLVLLFTSTLKTKYLFC